MVNKKFSLAVGILVFSSLSLAQSADWTDVFRYWHLVKDNISHEQPPEESHAIAQLPKLAEEMIVATIDVDVSVSQADESHLLFVSLGDIRVTRQATMVVEWGFDVDQLTALRRDNGLDVFGWQPRIQRILAKGESVDDRGEYGWLRFRSETETVRKLTDAAKSKLAKTAQLKAADYNRPAIHEQAKAAIRKMVAKLEPSLKADAIRFQDGKQ